MHRIVLILLLLLGQRSFSQNPAFTRYTVRDGLAGSAVYDALQDKNGYIWFATSQGVSRFDGKTFRNFSREDGLPDNEILKLYLDRHNNIWFISLSGLVSVFYNGAIRQMNDFKGVISITEDPITNSIQLLSGFTEGLTEKYGYYQSPNISGQWQFKRTIITVRHISSPLPFLKGVSAKTGYYFSVRDASNYGLSVKNYNSGKTVSYSFPSSNHGGFLPLMLKSLIAVDRQRNDIVFCTDSVFEADGNHMKLLFSLRPLGLQYVDVNAIYLENSNTLWLCTRNKGLLQVQHFRSPARTVRSFFPKVYCTGLIKDRENGYWITTHAEGVYYLPDLEAHYNTGTSDPIQKEVKCLTATPFRPLIAGFGNGELLSFEKDNRQYKPVNIQPHENRNNRILDIRPYKQRQLLVASDYGLHLVMPDNKSRTLVSWMGVKATYIASDTLVYLATGFGAFTFTPQSGEHKKFFAQRTTCINGIGPQVYWGTLNGLYTLVNDSIISLKDTYPGLGESIKHIAIAPDSAIWLATQQGVVILKDGKLTTIRRKDGLASNLCKHILTEGDTAWVSTDKGVSRLIYKWQSGALSYTLYNIDENDGLISPDANQTALSGKYLAIATSEGLCFIPRNNNRQAIPHPLINISSIINGDAEMPYQDTVRIDYRKNLLRIHLSGISFRSGKQLSYQYRFRNLDTGWINSANNLLEFSQLPFGIHTFEVRTIDRWGNKSNQVRNMTVVVAPPFWKTQWFMAAAFILAILLTGGIIYSYFIFRQRQTNKTYQLRKRMADMELMGLKAQINPHFIFNCLSSIQHYILQANITNANLYLHKFATLMREILHLSTTADLTLEEELKILQLYLDLEKLRLGERMQFRISVTNGIVPADLYLPPMIIQPYLENAVKHGTPASATEPLRINVHFSLSDNYLLCTIEDNGIGIAAGKERKYASPDYRPSGNHITASRINIINTFQDDKIQLEITDKKEKGLPGTGTIIRLFFPLSNE
ncbi:histidine kinase [Chitinophaga sp. Mgbs1]|uniref:Histidine kinase n=1 Tax=Chitinophaga solisilvae TaxID=1233460 RepID=A0A433W9I2_9BACT|nr:histidine kinase [Chitinophaga solisilvae]